MSSPIVVGLDPLSGVSASFELGVAFAGLTGAPLILAAVATDRLYDHVAERLAALAADAPAGVAAQPLALRRHALQPPLQDLAERRAAGLIVVGDERRGHRGRGHLARHLVHGARCPVAVAPPGYERPEGRPGRIGVAYVDTGAGREALAAGALLARRAGAVLHVVTVAEDHDAVPPPEPLDVEMELAVRDGDPATILAAESAGVDLLVCGSRGRGAAGSTLLGSVSRELVRRSRCPLVVVPRDGAGRLSDLWEPAAARATA